MEPISNETSKPAPAQHHTAQHVPSNLPIRVAAFYRFVALPDYASLQPTLKSAMEARDIKGSILLAEEGINATIAGAPDALEDFLAELQRDARFANLSIKRSHCETQPFQRSKVRLKKEIVPLGVPLSQYEGGTSVAPEAWNALISRPDMLVLDVRNHYEWHLGRFDGAVQPNTQHFREMPDYTAAHLRPEQPIAMYCTGGIRCEKYSAYLRELGFREVYQLEGGILQYLQQVPQEKSLWQGECFVFDERIAVGHGVQAAADVTMCVACGHPLTGKDREHPDYREGEGCGFCADTH